VDAPIAREFLPRMIDRYLLAGVEFRVCTRTMELSGSANKLKPATEKDWLTEYHDLIISIKVVVCVDEAIEHINRYGAGHTDAIVTRRGQPR